MTGPAFASPLLGRAKHLDVVRSTLEQARAGEARLVLVVGDPGVGKSRLVGEVSGEVGDDVRVLVTHCLELSGVVVPLAPGSRGILDTSVLIASDLQPLPGELAISVISVAELHYGVLVATSADARAQRLARVVGLQKRFDPLPVDEADADS